MYSKMKFTYIFLFLFIIVANDANAQQPHADTIYFCTEYKDGKEIGNNDTFATGPGGVLITVMFKGQLSIKERSVRVVVQKVLPDTMTQISSITFDVEPNWDYIFFSDIKFPGEGLYHVVLQRPDGSEIASNYVTLVLKEGNK